MLWAIILYESQELHKHPSSTRSTDPPAQPHRLMQVSKFSRSSVLKFQAGNTRTYPSCPLCSFLLPGPFPFPLSCGQPGGKHHITGTGHQEAGAAQHLRIAPPLPRASPTCWAGPASPSTWSSWGAHATHTQKGIGSNIHVQLQTGPSWLHQSFLTPCLDWCVLGISPSLSGCRFPPQCFIQHSNLYLAKATYLLSNSSSKKLLLP